MPQVPLITMNDGRTIPQLGFGVWQIPADDTTAAVKKALEVGYRHIDTAAAYENEEGVGKAIADFGLARDEVFVTTKLPNHEHARADAMPMIQTSLEKLGTDYVDLYLIHWPTPGKDNYVEAWQALEDMQRQGWARSIGVSNFQPDHLGRLQEECTVVPAVNQIELHPSFANLAVVAANERLGIQTESWSPLGQAEDLNEEIIVEMAGALGRTPAQVILRWHLQHGYIVIPKSATPKRIEQNFAVFDFELSDRQMAAIDALERGNRIGLHPDKFND
jgi:2,5-diketo-D-gluconate reductase A